MKIFYIFVFLLIIVTAERDFYAILGVKRDAKESAIKRAYRKLSLQYHPDKCKTEECKAKFIDIQKAYDVLSDDNQRRVYDNKGEAGLEEREKQKQGGGGFDPFGGLFGNHFGFGGNRQRNQDTQLSLNVALEDLYNGREFEIKINRQVICKKCRGTGADDPDHVHKCPVCNGSGVQLVRRQLAPGFVTQMQQTCQKCGGKGTIFDHVCPICRGNKLVQETHPLTVTIERGMANGQQLTFENEGNQHPDLDPGNVIVVLQQLNHRIFTRDGDNLKMNMSITLKEALLGWRKTFNHLDGRIVEAGKDSITKPGEVIRLEGEGMPQHNFPSQKGDLFITVTVVMPKSLSNKQKEVVQQFF
ncbi:hypothetical protein WA158_000359 [Blastocystis sp. Blastoise]